MKMEPETNRPVRWPMMLRLAAQTVAAMSLLSLGACSTVKVQTDSGRVTKESLRSAQLLGSLVTTPVSLLGTVASTSTSVLKQAAHLESKGQSVDAAGCYLKAAADAYELLAAGTEKPGSEAEKALIDLHNSSLSRFVELWMQDPRRDGSPGPFEFTCDGEIIEAHLSPGSVYHSGYFDRAISAEAVEEKGMVSKTRDGIGAAFVGIREQRPERADELKFYPPRGLHVPVTLTMDSCRKLAGSTKRAVTVSQRNPMLEQAMKVNGRSFSIAADFTAPIAVLLEGRNEAMWGLQGFFDANERIKNSGLYLTEPYDPKRIPVVLIHGLVSVPIIWRDIIPSFTSEPELSTRYQFMVFTYPSSYPIAESALLLREQLAAARAHFDPEGDDPLSRNMVVAGHSMGGILTHTLVADIGDNLWKVFSDEPFDSVDIDPVRKETIRKMLFFKPDPAVRRAIFISAPHRGAKMAESGLVGLISRTAKLPMDILNSTTNVINPDEAARLHLKVSLDKKVTAVQSLEPGAPVVKALEVSPYKKGVIYHSIIGDRGKGDTPNSSDGVVEYWSSHQDGAASELIVPTDHGAYKSPLAIDEIKRILREHVGLR
ncbi:MAG: alpha/beta hydrolase [Verrucomicrobiae bacterium]|nr:alpha/beta hydrolase [Verrucomicrobiae bacterium]